jgi:hypothetical protein
MSNARQIQQENAFLYLILGGLLGLAIYIAWIVLVVVWWSPYVSGGPEAWQGEGGWRFWVVATLGPIGLAISFAGLLHARSEEHSNPLLRRLLYGFNAVLAGQLVLMILIWLNIIGYLVLPRESDWTRARLYTLDPLSQNILKGLDRPVKVYMILDSRQDRAYDDMNKLLDNCRAVTDKVQSELVLRGRQDARVRELMRRYLLLDPVGMLVVMGTEPNEDSQFIKYDDLYEAPPFDPMRGRSRRREEPTFKGEDALMTAIRYLGEDKKKPTIYFLQGHGELDISSMSDARPRQKAQELRTQLEKANYEVKALRISTTGAAKEGDSQEVVAKQVPDDASVLVIAGPRGPLERETLEAIRVYMNPRESSKKKGKLMVLLGVETTPEKQMVQTGLENLLQEYSVKVGNERIMSPLANNPDAVFAVPNPRPSPQNTLAAGLSEMQPLPMFNARTVEARSNPAQRPEGSSYTPEMLLTTSVYRVWAESNLGDPLEVLETIRREQKEVRLANTLPLAVVVSEQSGAGIPGHPPGMLGGESKPRLVVFGNVGWASDAPLPGAQDARASSMYYSLFASSIAWLREKQSSIGIKSKKRDTYQMSEGANVSRMLLLPAGLMFVCILGVGLGVWVVRRR